MTPEETPLALPPGDEPVEEAPPRSERALFSLLVSVRMGGWLVAWVLLALGCVGTVRILREEPATLEDLGSVALHGRHATPRARGNLPAAENPRHEAARNKVEAGAVKQGIEDFERLLRETPDHVAYNLELGRIHLDLGRPERAEHFLERAAELAPERGMVFALLAEAQLRQGPERRAEGLANRLQAKQRGEDLKVVDRELARMYLEEGRHEKAIEFFRSVDPPGQDAEVQYLLARAHLERARTVIGGSFRAIRRLRAPEDVRAAGEYLKRVLELDPTHEGALAMKEEL